MRAWLAEHHTERGPIWLASYKKHHPDYIGDYRVLIEELLCWGWIDSVTRTLDADRAMILIAPRNPKSAWSAVNKANVERARASGAMTPFGEAKITAAIANGMWEFLDDVERLEVPEDLAAALTRGGGTTTWEIWPRSVKRGSLEWIKTARTEATRAARIAEVSGAAAEGRRPKPFARQARSTRS